MTWALLEQNKSGSVAIYKKSVWPFTQYKVLIKLRDSSEGAEFPYRFHSFKHYDKKAAFLRFAHLKDFFDRAEKKHAMRMVAWENFAITAVGFGETLGGHGVAVMHFHTSPQSDLDKGQLVLIDLPFDERQVAQKMVAMFGKKKSPTIMTGIREILDDAGLIDRLGDVNPSYANRLRQ